MTSPEEIAATVLFLINLAKHVKSGLLRMVAWHKGPFSRKLNSNALIAGIKTPTTIAT
jgi:hypothetical protein